MMKFLRGLLAAALVLAAPAAVAQPAQWNYSAPNNVATATYPGNVTILGSCTGCGGGVQLNVPNTWTALQTFNAGITGTTIAGTTGTFSGAVSGSSFTTTPSNGGSFTGGTMTITDIFERTVIDPAVISTTQNYDVLTQSLRYYTTNAANNWTLNIRGNAGNTLNSILQTNQTITVVMVTTQGGTAYYNTAVTIDGVAQTVKWMGGAAPASGNINSLDVYTYTIIKTAVSTYTVLGSLVQYK